MHTAVPDLSPADLIDERAVAADRLFTPPGRSVAGARRVPVTLVVPAYNREREIVRALRSAAAQQPWLPAEVIVVDDHSTDRTADVARQLGAHVISFERNCGAAAARNAAVRAASQGWIALLDSDDEWLPHHLRTLWPLREQRVLVAGSVIRPATPSGGRRFYGVLSPTTVRSPAPLVFPENFVPATATMARRDVVLSVGGFSEDTRYAEDFDLWLRVLGCGPGHVTPVVTALWHAHGGQKSSAVDAPLASHRRIVARYEGAPWWSRALFERRLGTQGWDLMRVALKARDGSAAAREAATLLTRPQRLTGALLTVARRERLQRRASRVASDGGPTIAVLAGGELPPAASGWAHDAVVDLRDRSAAAALRRLALRPAGAAIGPPARLAALRALGVPPLGRRPRSLP